MIVRPLAALLGSGVVAFNSSACFTYERTHDVTESPYYLEQKACLDAGTLAEADRCTDAVKARYGRDGGPP